MRAVATVVIACAAACTAAPGPRAVAVGDSSKPQAPLELTLSAERVAPRRYAVSLEGRALADLPAVELALVLPPGASLVGGQRTLRAGRATAGARVLLLAEVAAAGGELVATGRAGDNGRAVSLRLGEAPPAPPARVVITPFGPVAESR